MKWKGKRQSSNIEDRRGRSGSSSGRGGFNPNLIVPLVRILFSKTGLIIVGLFLAFSLITSTNPLRFLGQFFVGDNNQSEASSPYKGNANENEMADFSATILASTEDVWNEILDNYREPTLVIFTGTVVSACGTASSATGPFYCPGDEKLYLDLSFFQDMERKLNASGDFAQAYVIAHEVGHHIQNIMGITNKVQSLMGKMSKTDYNKYSVRLELQADFFAGVWAFHSQKKTKMMEEGDLEEALNAAFAIGDDRLQKQSTGVVVPDSFTHGTSKQRVKWFKKGFATGDIEQGDTFNANPL
ncbi:MAG: neutral zinc metallopeptidase [Flavobacteriaceae bacterium]|nr:neutral zinc metallopeptidase [Flavobacteriaceae bacterium]